MASKRDIIDSIKLGRISEAISMLEELIANDRKNPRAIIIISSQFNRLRVERNNATISAVEYETELNRIVSNLLNIIDEIDEITLKKERILETPSFDYILKFLSDFKAIKAAIDIWGVSRNGNASKTALYQGRNVRANSQLEAEAAHLLELVPVNVIESIERRVRRCWERYEEILDSDHFLSGEIDEATEAVIKCICRELKRLIRLNGNIPEGIMRRWWTEYSCDLS